MKSDDSMRGGERHSPWRLWAAAGAVGVALVALMSGTRTARPAAAIPTAVVRQGVFRDQLPLRGELKANRSIILSAPMGAGQLQVINLIPDGTNVRPGTVIVQFDSSQLKEQLAEDESTLATAEAEIRQAEAQGRLTEQQDVTAVKTAEYTLEAAKLDASKQAILSKIDGEEALLKVADDKLALRQAKEKLKMDRASDAAAVVDQKQKRAEAAFNVRRDEEALAKMTLRAPIAGSVTILSHWTPNGRQTFRPGDQAWPGAAIAELPDLSTLYFSARADEIDRSRLKVGQPAVVTVAATPGRQFKGSVQMISTLASVDFSAPWPFPRDFEVAIHLTGQSLVKLRPGMSATARVTLQTVPHAILVPAQAVFEKNRGTVAYVEQGGKFRAQPVKVGERGNGVLVVTQGLKPGERVALKDPTRGE